MIDARKNFELAPQLQLEFKRVNHHVVKPMPEALVLWLCKEPLTAQVIHWPIGHYCAVRAGLLWTHKEENVPAWQSVLPALRNLMSYELTPM